MMLKFSSKQLTCTALRSLLLLLALGAPCARAQYIGQVSPLTTQQTLANSVTCTGAAQNFPVSNLGQTQHQASASVSGAITFTMEIDGIDNLGKVFRISDPLIGTTGNAVINGSGYYPIVRVSVTCTAGGTFSVSYSGSSSTAYQNVAAALAGSTNKLVFAGAPAGSNRSLTFQTPYGSCAGSIVFTYLATGPSGSTLTVQGQSAGGATLGSVQTFSPATGTAAQTFAVSPASCPFVVVTYTAGGASGATYNLEYVFSAPGTINLGNVQGPYLYSTDLNAGSGAVNALNPLVMGGLTHSGTLSDRVAYLNLWPGSQAGSCVITSQTPCDWHIGIGSTTTQTALAMATSRTAFAGGNAGTASDGPLATLLYGAPANPTDTNLNIPVGNTPGFSLNGGVNGEQHPSGLVLSKSGFSFSTSQNIAAAGTTTVLILNGSNHFGTLNSCHFSVRVTTATGTTPTLDVYVQDSDSNAANGWDDRAHFLQFTTTAGNQVAAIIGAQFTATGTGAALSTARNSTDATISAGSTVSGPLGAFLRFKFVVAGTTPNYVFTAYAVCQQ